MPDTSEDGPRLSLFRLRWALLRELLRMSRATVPVLGLLVLLPSLLRGALTVASGAVAGAVPDAVRHGYDSPDGRRAMVALLVVGISFAVQMSLNPVRGAVADVIGRRLEGDPRAREMPSGLGP